MKLDPTLRAIAIERAREDLAAAADLREQAAAREARALLLGRTWVFAVDANRGEVYEDGPEDYKAAPVTCTCQQPWSSHGNYAHAIDCPADV